MAKKSIILNLVFLIILLGACTKNRLWKASDLIPEKTLITPVKGMACVPSGPVFLSSYLESGCMGYIDSLGHSEKYLKLPKGTVVRSMAFDTHWNLYLTDSENQTVLLLRSGDASASVFLFDSTMVPEDIAVTSKGIIFLSGFNPNSQKGNLYRIMPDSSVKILDSMAGKISGIALDTTGEILYAGDALTQTIWKFKLNDKGEVLKKEKFLQYPDYKLGCLKCDAAGNLFISRVDNGVINIVSSEGKLLREVELTGKKPVAITFGGYNGRTCYVSLEDRGCIERFFTENPGRDWAMLRLK